jgi:hypothetical protein
MSTLVRLSPDDLQTAAVRALKKSINAEFAVDEWIPGTKLHYHVAMTPFGPRCYSIVARNFKAERRYPLGFRPELFPYVDEFAIYLHDEPIMYLIPQRVLIRDVYDRIETPSINERGQWFCNLDTRSHELESKGLSPRALFRRYTVKL